MSSRVSRLWNRLPRIVRRGATIVALYQTVQYVSTSDKLYKLFSPGAHVLGGTVLDLDLNSVNLVANDARRAATPLSSIDQLSLPQVVKTLRAARDDPRVAALVVRGLNGLAGIGLAEVTELREAIKSFSSGIGGKPSMLHVPEGYGLTGNGTESLYFASGFDSSHIQPTSAIIAPGLSFASIFLKGTLDKLGITSVTVARKEYKTAANMFKETEYTEPHRESTEALLDAVMEVLVEGVADGRNLDPADVKAAIDIGLLTADEARKRNLIDECAYRDELPQILRHKLMEGVEARSKSRSTTELAWKSAMKNLTNAWSIDDGAEIKKWDGGRRIQEIGTLQAALAPAVLFGDGTSTKYAQMVIDAEIEAFKAHLNWIDSRPWEAVPRSKRQDHILYSIGNIASIVELERRLCVESIEALEGFGKDLSKLREIAKLRDGLLTFNEAKQILRWVKSLWRAKALAARMQDCLRNESDLVTAIADTIDKVESSASASGEVNHDAVIDLTPAPRFFLVHEPGSDSTPVTSETDDFDNKDLMDYMARTRRRGEWKDKLRYVRFGDYIEQNSQEQQAAYRRNRSWLRQNNPLAYIKGFPDEEYLGGLIDSREQIALYRLAQHSAPFLQPWRMLRGRGAPTVAVIDVAGAIADQGADEIRSAIRRADKDVRVHAIVLRVESPGGSASASDLISRAIEVARKPVVASMGSVCASGGYFVSAPSDVIFAENSTITGSIGVILSTFRFTELFEKLGISVDSVDSGKFAKYFGAVGSIAEWDSAFRARIDELIDDMYQTFVSAASRGRGIDFDSLEKIARGRVWSGMDALKLGLIDRIGGLQDAVSHAAELAGAEPSAGVHAVTYPSISMLLEDRLRRVGVLPSHLDEEGDELVPRSKRRRRSGLAMLIGLDDELDDDITGADKSEDDEKDVLASNVIATPDGKKNGGTGGGTGAQVVAALSNGERGRHGNCESIFDAPIRDTFFSSCVLWMLRHLDNHLMSPNPSRIVASCANHLMDVFVSLDSSGIAQALTADIHDMQATNGRPAMMYRPELTPNRDSRKS